MLCSRNVVGHILVLIAAVIINGVNSKPPNRIYGGRLAEKHEFGAVVSLPFPDSRGHNCGGAIIGPRHVLTAGHCVDHRTSDQLIVRAGINDIRDTEHVVERGCAKIIRHPDYISWIKGYRPVQNDLVVLVLKEDLPIGGTIKALKLPNHPPSDADDYVTAGWGANSPHPTVYQHELKTETMTIGNKALCGAVPKTVCAYSNHGTSCPGDSGSPLMKDGYVYGITSTSMCMIGDPVDFVNVYEYLDWIEATVRENP